MNLNKHSIKVSFTRLNRTRGDTKSPMAFHAVIETPQGTFSSPWSVGVGHAKLYPGVYTDDRRAKPYRPVKTLHDVEALDWGILKYKPVPEDMICHILCFSEALDVTFPEWAETFGESEDSIKAKACYESYRDQNIILKRAFGDQWDAMVEYAREQ